MIENNTEVINDMLGSEFRSNIGFSIQKGSSDPTDKLDENKNIKQVRYSTRLDYVPALEKNKLEKFYKARK